jgi:hypothetical protein
VFVYPVSVGLGSMDLVMRFAPPLLCVGCADV